MTTPESGDDPYVVLGVGRDVDEAALKSAYRRQAKLNHPDLHAGKNAVEQNAFLQQFQRAQWAFDLLSDPGERAYFDRHGRQKRNLAAAQMSPEEKTIAELLSSELNPNEQMTAVDWVLRVRGKLGMKLLGLQQEEAKLRFALGKLEKLLGRFTRDGDVANALSVVIQSQVDNLKVQLARNGEEREFSGRCLNELGHYEFRCDQAVNISGYYISYAASA